MGFRQRADQFLAPADLKISERIKPNGNKEKTVESMRESRPKPFPDYEQDVNDLILCKKLQSDSQVVPNHEEYIYTQVDDLPFSRQFFEDPAWFLTNPRKNSPKLARAEIHRNSKIREENREHENPEKTADFAVPDQQSATGGAKDFSDSLDSFCCSRKNYESPRGSIRSSSDEFDEESEGFAREVPSVTSKDSKGKRIAETHQNSSDKRRRAKINKKLRMLQELIPNCNEVDKASVLEKAIEYVKTLQLQLQMMSMGIRFYVPPVISPIVMHQINNCSYFPYFSPMAMAMGTAMFAGHGNNPANSGGSSPIPRAVPLMPVSNSLFFPLHQHSSEQSQVFPGSTCL